MAGSCAAGCCDAGKLGSSENQGVIPNWKNRNKCKKKTSKGVVLIRAICITVLDAFHIKCS